jgi:hypothetical protein
MLRLVVRAAFALTVTCAVPGENKDAARPGPAGHVLPFQQKMLEERVELGIGLLRR